MKQKSTDISIIIPAFNEEDRISKTLHSILDYLKARTITVEIIVVDDGSNDDTAQIVNNFESSNPNITLLSLPYNRGKGFAVKYGMRNANGRLMLYNDADGASPIEEIERLEAAIQNGADVAIGSRALYSTETSIETLWYRKLLGRIFNGLVNFIILPRITDTQCGFKMFSREAATYVFSRQRADRYSFDVEILFLARKAGFKIAEVPINWTNVPGSKVNLIVDSTSMLLDVIKFRLRDFLGGYEEVTTK